MIPSEHDDKLRGFSAGNELKTFREPIRFRKKMKLAQAQERRSAVRSKLSSWLFKNKGVIYFSQTLRRNLKPIYRFLSTVNGKPLGPGQCSKAV